LHGQRNAVFSLQVNNDGVHLPRIDVRWEVLPRGAEGIAERELSILAVNAMTNSTFAESLQFQLGKGSVSALVPSKSSIAGLKFMDFTFESPAVHASMHGRWIASSRETLRCGEMRCVIGYVVTYSHDINKVKVE
jgi:hypothetical protein